MNAPTAVATLLLAWFRLPQAPPVPAADGEEAISATLFGRYRRLLGDRRFVAQVALLAFAQSSFFVFLAGSSYVFQEVHGLSPLGYAAIYGASAIAWVGAAQFAPAMITRIGGERLAAAGLRIAALAMLILLALTVAGLGSGVAIVLAVTVMFGGIGITMPTVTVIALHEHGRAAGTATALMGTLNFALGATMSASLSALPAGGDLPMVALMTACVATAWALTPVALSPGRSLEKPA